MSEELGKNRTMSNLRGYIQSPFGNLALISTRPYLKKLLEVILDEKTGGKE